MTGDVMADVVRPRRGGRMRWPDFRNRLIANPRFQRWAAKNPLTRRIAAKRAARLFDVCAGFVYSQTLFACVEVRLFARLAEGPLPVVALAALCGLKPDAMRRLLEAAAPLGLVEDRGGDRFGLGADGAALLGNPGIDAMIAHHSMFYRDLADPLSLFKAERLETELSRFWPYATAQAPGQLATDEVAAYSELMSRSVAFLAEDVLDAYALTNHSALLDIGGGGGDFLLAAGRRHPHLRLQLFDLPAVAARARTRLAAERRDAALAIGGDFKRDPLPAGADIVALVRVAHDLDDADLDALLAKIRAALPANGVLLLAEPMAETPGARRLETYFTAYFSAMRRGRLRSVADLTRRLHRAGFAAVEARKTSRPLLAGVLVARVSAERPVQKR